MMKEIEMAAGTDYIVPLSDGRRLIVGRRYGVSDNAIRKWIKSYEKYGV